MLEKACALAAESNGGTPTPGSEPWIGNALDCYHTSKGKSGSKGEYAPFLPVGQVQLAFFHGRVNVAGSVTFVS